MPEIQIHLVEGRTIEQKRALVRRLTDAVTETLGTPADQVVVQIIESPAHNKAKGGVLFSDREPPPPPSPARGPDGS